MLLRVRGLTRANGQFVAVALNDENGRELVPISDEKAREIQVEFERELPRIEAAAAADFPVPVAIPVEVDEPSSDTGQQNCPNCPHPMSQHTFKGCNACPCRRPPSMAKSAQWLNPRLTTLRALQRCRESNAGYNRNQLI